MLDNSSIKYDWILIDLDGIYKIFILFVWMLEHIIQLIFIDTELLVDVRAVTNDTKEE